MRTARHARNTKSQNRNGNSSHARHHANGKRVNGKKTKTIRGRKFPVEVLTADEVRALLNACSARAPTGVRNRALIVLLWRCGLRISEALALMPKDFDQAGGVIRVLHGKNDKSRTVGIDPEAASVVARWLDKRSKLAGMNGRHPLLCTLQGDRMQTSYTRNLFKRLARKAGIQKRTHAHALRHSFSFSLANENVPPHLIQSALGHSSLAVTSRYIGHIAPVEVIAAMKQRAWGE